MGAVEILRSDHLIMWALKTREGKILSLVTQYPCGRSRIEARVSVSWIQESWWHWNPGAAFLVFLGEGCCLIQTHQVSNLAVFSSLPVLRDFTWAACLPGLSILHLGMLLPSALAW